MPNGRSAFWGVWVHYCKEQLKKNLFKKSLQLTGFTLVSVYMCLLYNYYKPKNGFYLGLFITQASSRLFLSFGKFWQISTRLLDLAHISIAFCVWTAPSFLSPASVYRLEGLRWGLFIGLPLLLNIDLFPVCCHCFGWGGATETTDMSRARWIKPSSNQASRYKDGQVFWSRLG